MQGKYQMMRQARIVLVAGVISIAAGTQGEVSGALTGLVGVVTQGQGGEKVSANSLPNVLENCPDAATWRNQRRGELLNLFQSRMYGRSPGASTNFQFEVTDVDTNALGGKAIRKQVLLRMFGVPVHLLVYLPAHATNPVPVFVIENFGGNHSLEPDPRIKIYERWTVDRKTLTGKISGPDESTRGKASKDWPLEMILSRGYAVATMPREDIEPDFADGWIHGIRGAWLKQSGRTTLAPDDWGAIGAWAFGLSRALDYLETDSSIDAKRAIAIGHSRLGKTALWAGALDERFAMVIANNSGEGGAALARRRSGETTALINKTFPHWFCANFKQYNDREDKLPFDQHELIALIAPRPVYVGSAKDDLWADPLGEFLGAKGAEPVYLLLGKPGLGVDKMPAENHPVGETIGYHIRSGGHSITPYDWKQYLNFADRHFKASPVNQVASSPSH